MGIVRRIILFLGAGASTCFGYPTTKQFIDGLRAELAISSAAEVQLLNKILSIQGFSDVEHVLELLDLLQSVNRHPFTDFIQTYPSVINFGETASSFSDLLHSAKRLRDKIQEDVFRQYEFNPDSLVKINDVYSPLIQNLMANNIERYLSIFTTNYDRVIESFCINKKIEYVDGFKRINDSEDAEWYPKQYSKLSEREDKAMVRLFKLHGSLNWRELKDGTIVRVSPEEITRGTRRYKKTL